MLGDLNIAEPKALIGFAGPRVIEQTIRQKLPEGFQRSEFLLENGIIDIDRRPPRAEGTVTRVLRFGSAGAGRRREQRRRGAGGRDSAASGGANRTGRTQRSP